MYRDLYSRPVLMCWPLPVFQSNDFVSISGRLTSYSTKIYLGTHTHHQPHLFFGCTICDMCKLWKLLETNKQQYVHPCLVLLVTHRCGPKLSNTMVQTFLWVCSKPFQSKPSGSSITAPFSSVIWNSLPVMR
jgi:hypothetical protein